MLICGGFDPPPDRGVPGRLRLGLAWLVVAVRFLGVRRRLFLVRAAREDHREYPEGDHQADPPESKPNNERVDHHVAADRVTCDELLERHEELREHAGLSWHVGPLDLAVTFVKDKFLEPIERAWALVLLELAVAEIEERWEAANALCRRDWERARWTIQKKVRRRVSDGWQSTRDGSVVVRYCIRARAHTVRHHGATVATAALGRLLGRRRVLVRDIEGRTEAFANKLAASGAVDLGDVRDSLDLVGKFIPGLSPVDPGGIKARDIGRPGLGSFRNGEKYSGYKKGDVWGERSGCNATRAAGS